MTAPGRHACGYLVLLLRLLPLALWTRGHLFPWVCLIRGPPTIQRDEFGLVYDRLADWTCGVVRTRVHPLKGDLMDSESLKTYLLCECMASWMERWKDRIITTLTAQRLCLPEQVSTHTDNSIFGLLKAYVTFIHPLVTFSLLLPFPPTTASRRTGHLQDKLAS